jgi:hypothetical protein
VTRWKLRRTFASAVRAQTRWEPKPCAYPWNNPTCQQALNASSQAERPRIGPCGAALTKALPIILFLRAYADGAHGFQSGTSVSTPKRGHPFLAFTVTKGVATPSILSVRLSQCGDLLFMLHVFVWKQCGKRPGYIEARKRGRKVGYVQRQAQTCDILTEL